MRKIIICLAIVAATSPLRAIDGRPETPFGTTAGGSMYISHNGTNQYSTFVQISRVQATPKIDFETGEVALSPTKAAALAYHALTDHFKDLKDLHIEWVTLHTYKLPDGQHGYYAVCIQGNERHNPPVFVVPVYLDGQAVIPVAYDDK